MRESLLSVGRRYVEDGMTSACVITRLTGSILNETTGRYDDEVETVYTGRCHVVLSSPRVFARNGQDQLISEQQPILKLPIVGSEGITVGDVATITSSPMDSGLVGTQLHIAGVHPATYATARRLPVYAITPVPADG